MRADIYRVEVLPDGWRVWVVNCREDAMPSKMGHRVAEWVGKWGPCALYAPVTVSDETWSAALEYARQHSEMSF